MFSVISRIGVIGWGNMGKAMAGGILGSGLLNKEAFSIYDKNVEITDFPSALSCAEVAAQSDLVILAVKPGQVEEVCQELKGARAILSVAAGKNIDSILESLDSEEIPVIRAMPNTPALVNEGMTVYFTSPSVTDAYQQDVHQLLSTIGQACRVKEESHIDIATAISGSGPAYFFSMVEVLTESGIKLGLDSDTAALLAKQTARGAGILVSESEDTPTELRIKVTSPGGTTAAGLGAMEKHGFGKAVEAGPMAAHKRAVELGEADKPESVLAPSTMFR